MATSITESYLPDGLPIPVSSNDGLDAPYWEATKRHELVVQQCNNCKTYHFGPEWICYNCQSLDLGYTEVDPEGMIYSWERAWHPVHPALRDNGPYLVVLVELPHAGNVRMVGNLLGDPAQEVVIGSAVEAVFEDHEGDQPFTLVQWSLKI
jgi:uncharacterized OB-fold protein